METCSHAFLFFSIQLTLVEFHVRMKSEISTFIYISFIKKIKKNNMEILIFYLSLYQAIKFALEVISINHSTKNNFQFTDIVWQLKNDND